ncbi:unnamed protein product [Nippostrongylus brasiliensis]|uniref:PAP2_C domain-containing protein n=1 Tax=Nippostrongylus brasiliensis TaxID=27835 RepID=A0A0N4Y6D4_NIPBR|nr:unnamed protein product [Nippostrongylus brasiliensis]
MVGSSAVSECPLVKWIFLVCYCLAAGFCNWAALAITHDISTREPLSDMVFRLLDEQSWASRLGDYLVSVTVASFCLLLIFHRARAIIARRFLFIAGTLYSFRSITLSVTQLPPGEFFLALSRLEVSKTEQLRERKKGKSRQNFMDAFLAHLFIRLRFLSNAVLRHLFQDKTKMLCGDMLFSGHTLSLYIPHTCALVGMVCMVISRTHYTIDILVAYWLSNFVFRLYHAFCEVDIFMERRNSVIYGMWIFRIVDWLEDDIVPGRVTNEFEFPLDSLFRLLLREETATHHKQISISSASTFNLP